MNAQAFWIEVPNVGRLAILARPRGGDWLEDEIRSWQMQGVNVVVSLLSASEIDEFGLANESAKSAAAGIEYVSLPIPDRGVPPSAEHFEEVVSRLSDAVTNGKSVGIHCRAGVGRSAMLAASLLIVVGISSKDAFERIRAARGVPVPDTSDQRAWVERFAERHLVKAI
jgi:protein-tyrosine phosphatase